MMGTGKTMQMAYSKLTNEIMFYTYSQKYNFKDFNWLLDTG